VGLDDIGFEQRVVIGACKRDAVIQQNVLVELDVLSDLLVRIAREPIGELCKHAIAIELVRRPGVAVRDGDVAGATRLDRQRDAHDLSSHRIEARRFGIERGQLGRLDGGEPARERRVIADNFIIRWERRLRLCGRFGRRLSDEAAQVVLARSLFCDVTGDVGGWFFAAGKIAEPRLEFEALIQPAQRRHVNGRRHEIRWLDRQIAIGFDGEKRTTLRQPRERLPQVLADHPGYFVCVLDDVVE
jgi:hypothetical protein